jgi:hypothetical protein
MPIPSVWTRPCRHRPLLNGSISHGDKEKYSLRTGAPEMMGALRERDGATGPRNRISEGTLIDEMKGGRQWIFIGIGGAVLLLILVLILAR